MLNKHFCLCKKSKYNDKLDRLNSDCQHHKIDQDKDMTIQAMFYDLYYYK